MIPFKSKYIFSLLLFITNNNRYFTYSKKKNSVHTRHSNDLYLPLTKLVIYKRGAYYSHIKIFNNIPPDIKNTSGNL